MKTLVTHIRPHLDDICAMWLLKKYDSSCHDAALAFIPYKNGEIASEPEKILIGIGRGTFDEHKGDIGECATSLVFAHLRTLPDFSQKDASMRRALEKIVDWVLRDDTGRLMLDPDRKFSISSVLLAMFYTKNHDSTAATEIGFSLLDGLLDSLIDVAVLENDWQARIPFMSRFGAAVGIESSARSIESYAYSQEFDIVVSVNREHTYHNIRARVGSNVDLTPAYEQLKKIDPDADWFFHHSKAMLICGDKVTPTNVDPHKISKLTLAQLIDLVR